MRYTGEVESAVPVDTQRIFDACQKSSELERCYGDKFWELGKNRKFEHTMDVFYSLQSVDPSTLSCHFIAHKISQAEVSKNPSLWLDVIGKIDLNSCSRGFFHGAIEGYLQLDPDFVLNKNTIVDICDKVSKRTSSNLSKSHTKSMCMHTVGHMVLVQAEGNVDNGLEICSQLSVDTEKDCYDGVFMENINRENLQLHDLAEDLDWNEDNTFQIERLCKKYSGVAAGACWEGVSEMYGSISNGDSTRLYSLCLAVPENADRENCYAKGSGFMAFLIASGKSNPKGGLTSLCKENDGQRNKCIQHVISYVLNSSKSYKDQILSFCDNLPADSISFCHRESIRI